MMRLRSGLCGLAVLALLTSCKEDKAAVEPPRPVLSVLAVVRTTDTLGPFAGSIQPRYSTDFSFRLFGRMVARFVDIGSVVKAGDKLATLDPILQANAVRDAQAAVASTRAQLVNAEAEETRQRVLFERNITPAAQFDLIVQSRQTAAANLIRAQSTLRRAEDALSFTQLRADFDGIVTGVAIAPGQVVNPSQRIMTIARPEIREAVIAVPNALADALSGGEKFDMTTDLDQTASMKVTAVRGVDPVADAITRTRAVFLTLDDPPPAFRLGITISVTMTKPVSPRVDLPATALFDRDGKAQVWIVDPKTMTVATREVTVAARDDEMAIVSAGIASGERVVTAGVHSLTAGQPVKVPQ